MDRRKRSRQNTTNKVVKHHPNLRDKGFIAVRAHNSDCRPSQTDAAAVDDVVVVLNILIKVGLGHPVTHDQVKVNAVGVVARERMRYCPRIRSSVGDHLLRTKKK